MFATFTQRADELSACDALEKGSEGDVESIPRWSRQVIEGETTFTRETLRFSHPDESLSEHVYFVSCWEGLEDLVYVPLSGMTHQLRHEFLLVKEEGERHLRTCPLENRALEDGLEDCALEDCALEDYFLEDYNLEGCALKRALAAWREGEGLSKGREALRPFKDGCSTNE